VGVFPDATRATRATRRERAPTPRDRHDVHGVAFGERDAVDEASRGRSSSSRRAGSGVGIAFRERVNPRLLEPRARDVRRKRRACGRGDRARGLGERDANATHHLDGFLRTWMTPRTLRQLERAAQARARASKAGNLRSSKPKKNDQVTRYQVSARKTRSVSANRREGAVIANLRLGRWGADARAKISAAPPLSSRYAFANRRVVVRVGYPRREEGARRIPGRTPRTSARSRAQLRRVRPHARSLVSFLPGRTPGRLDSKRI
jgi:hypothetical protein